MAPHVVAAEYAPPLTDSAAPSKSAEMYWSWSQSPPWYPRFVELYWKTLVAFCQLASQRHASTPLAPTQAVSSPRMNSPRKSNVPDVPSVFFTPLVVPSAGDQLVGHEVQKKAITAPCGTERPFRSFKSATIAFQASFESVCPAMTSVSAVNAAYE